MRFPWAFARVERRGGVPQVDRTEDNGRNAIERLERGFDVRLAHGSSEAMRANDSSLGVEELRKNAEARVFLPIEREHERRGGVVGLAFESHPGDACGLDGAHGKQSTRFLREWFIPAKRQDAASLGRARNLDRMPKQKLVEFRCAVVFTGKVSREDEPRIAGGAPLDAVVAAPRSEPAAGESRSSSHARKRPSDPAASACVAPSTAASGVGSTGGRTRPQRRESARAIDVASVAVTAGFL